MNSLRQKKNVFTDTDSIKQIKKPKKPTEYYYKGKREVGRPLGIRVSPKGKKSFFIYYYADSKTKKFTLGVFGSGNGKLSLADARALSLEYADRDPVAEKKQDKIDAGNAIIAAKEKKKADELEAMSVRTMSDLWNLYYSLPKTKQKASNTLKEELRKWTKNIKPVLGTVPVKKVTPAMISSLLTDYAEKSPVSANRLYSFLRILFKPALANGWIIDGVHPMQWIDKPSIEKPRENWLKDHEIKEIWPHLDNLTDNPRDILRICLLTAQRSGEVSSLKWSDIDINQKLWTQTENKTDTTFLVPLSKQVMGILKNRNNFNKGEWVFPSSYNVAKGAKSGHAKCTKNAREKVHKWSGVSGWTQHDLRRTARTIMSRLKIKQHIRERVLNHSQGGVEGVYDQYDYLDEKRDALRKLGNEIARIVGLDVDKGKVIQLRKSA